MRRILFVLVVLTASALAQNCVRCGAHHTCITGFAQACIIDDTSCTSCGVCNGPACSLPIQPIGPFSTNVPWIQTANYISSVKKVSPLLALVSAKLQEHAKQGKCVQSADGYINDPNGSGEVHFQRHASSVSQVTWIDYRGPNKLVLTASGWTVFETRKLWFDRKIASGSY